MKEPILDVHNLRKHFKGSGGFLEGKPRWVKALDGVTFKVLPGETFGVVGETFGGEDLEWLLAYLEEQGV
ncbi:MAG: hypothetical protein R6V15_09955, partial [Desulfotignum sp.]